jgi:hypothetical protein
MMADLGSAREAKGDGLRFLGLKQLARVVFNVVGRVGQGRRERFLKQVGKAKG